jgi:hypothetical protein
VLEALEVDEAPNTTANVGGRRGGCPHGRIFFDFGVPGDMDFCSPSGGATLSHWLFPCRFRVAPEAVGLGTTLRTAAAGGTIREEGRGGPNCSSTNAGRMGWWPGTSMTATGRHTEISGGGGEELEGVELKYPFRHLLRVYLGSGKCMHFCAL